VCGVVPLPDTGPDGGNPIQVTIHADHASLTVAYWSTGEHARKTIREALGYLSVIERETGWTTFGPPARA
jgi:hypothetical protein